MNRSNAMEADLDLLDRTLNALHREIGSVAPLPSLRLIDVCPQDKPETATWVIMIEHMPVNPARYGSGLNYLNLIMILEPSYPMFAPKGIYISNEDQHSLCIAGSLRSRFNLFDNAAAHNAMAFEHFTWICLGFRDHHWRYGVPHGENLSTLFRAFYHHA